MTPKRIRTLAFGLTALITLAPLATHAEVPTAPTGTRGSARATQTTIPTLDTSSLGLFRVSLDKMLVSLSPKERTMLNDALRRLADEELFNGEAPGGKALSFKTPPVQVLYDSMAGELNGLTFGEILRLKA